MITKKRLSKKRHNKLLLCEFCNIFLVLARNPAGLLKACNIQVLEYFKFNRYKAVLQIFEVPLSYLKEQ
jgi:hypothetical protein